MRPGAGLASGLYTSWVHLPLGGTGCDVAAAAPPRLASSWTLAPRHLGTWRKVTRLRRPPPRASEARGAHPWPRFVEPCCTASALITEKIVVGMEASVVLSGFDGTPSFDAGGSLEQDIVKLMRILAVVSCPLDYTTGNRLASAVRSIPDMPREIPQPPRTAFPGSDSTVLKFLQTTSVTKNRCAALCVIKGFPLCVMNS